MRDLGAEKEEACLKAKAKVVEKGPSGVEKRKEVAEKVVVKEKEKRCDDLRDGRISKISQYTDEE